MFCPRPFTEMYIDERGDCHLCCPFWMNKVAGNVLTASPLEIWNGATATELRATILDQSFKHCSNCGNRSIIRDTASPYDLSVVDVLTLSYDQTCNLACPSCRVSAKGASPMAHKIHRIVIDSGILRYVKCLRAFGGGDALASSLFRELLRRLPTLDCHPEMTLSLQTNGLLLTPERYDEVLRSGFPIKEVLVSVDASNAATYKLVRGGDWNVLMTNIANLRGKGVRTQMNFVVQDINYREISDFVELAHVLGVNDVYFSELENWGTYDTSDYLERAVHRPDHPHHADLVRLLNESSLWRHRDLQVALTNLRHLVADGKKS